MKYLNSINLNATTTKTRRFHYFQNEFNRMKVAAKKKIFHEMRTKQLNKEKGHRYVYVCVNDRLQIFKQRIFKVPLTTS